MKKVIVASDEYDAGYEIIRLTEIIGANLSDIDAYIESLHFEPSSVASQPDVISALTDIDDRISSIKDELADMISKANMDVIRPRRR